SARSPPAPPRSRPSSGWTGSACRAPPRGRRTPPSAPAASPPPRPASPCDSCLVPPTRQTEAAEADADHPDGDAEAAEQAGRPVIGGRRRVLVRLRPGREPGRLRPSLRKQGKDGGGVLGLLRALRRRLLLPLDDLAAGVGLVGLEDHLVGVGGKAAHRDVELLELAGLDLPARPGDLGDGLGQLAAVRLDR